MLIPFTKMHGLGNDYIVIEALNTDSPTSSDGFGGSPNPSWTAEQWSGLAAAVCDRHFGIGSDGLIAILPSAIAQYRMRMFNPDGSEAQMCGNGIRCFSRYVFDRGLTESTDLDVETLAGIKRVSFSVINGRVASVRVNMGVPIFEAAKIPVFPASGKEKREGQVCGEVGTVKDYPLAVAGRIYVTSFVSMGNPHAVVFMGEDEVNGLDLAALGPQFELHEMFPERMNTEFCAILDRQTIRMRVWERGAHETLACGTGACGVAAVAIDHGYVDHKVDIVLDGGRLIIEWGGAGRPVYMSGPAEYICTGEYHYALVETPHRGVSAP